MEHLHLVFKEREIGSKSTVAPPDEGKKTKMMMPFSFTEGGPRCRTSPFDFSIALNLFVAKANFPFWFYRCAFL